MQHSHQSWDNVSNWYDKLVGAKGQYFHQHVIFPNVLSLLRLKTPLSVLDLGCGQGVFCRELSDKGHQVTGVDASKKLIEQSKHYRSKGAIEYIVDDARTLRNLQNRTFDRVVSILSLQNIDPIDGVFSRVKMLLKPGGTFVVVILHPCFRSPRITGWGEDEQRKLQYRRVDRYLTPMEIPIQMHPGKERGPITWTYHRSLSTYSKLATSNGLMIDAMEEWTSDKQSEGKFAKMENLARSEIPMFMAIRFKKVAL
ncbi:class I SAM-dependent methyltransferase [Candidatus Woesebacteria bacterium]|nr:class I SAM-dependent methyltransferase [Candidatus Woesebacteria bacterium]